VNAELATLWHVAFGTVPCMITPTTHHTSSSTSKKLRVKITHTPQQEKLLLLATRPGLLYFSGGVFSFFPNCPSFFIIS